MVPVTVCLFIQQAWRETAGPFLIDYLYRSSLTKKFQIEIILAMIQKNILILHPQSSLRVGLVVQLG